LRSQKLSRLYGGPILGNLSPAKVTAGVDFTIPYGTSKPPRAGMFRRYVRLKVRAVQ
jgi:hypothetical protein